MNHPYTLAAALIILGSSAIADDNEQHVSDIEGLWQLVEWHDDGEVLVPPRIGGRSLLENGRLLFMAHRETSTENEYVSGFGEYSIVGSEYSYEYERYTVVVVRGDVHEASSGPVSRSSYTGESNGSRLEILDSETRTRGLILEGNRMIWISDSKPLRVYERISD